MFHIEREIAQQPEVVACLLNEQTHTAQKIAAAIRAFNPVFVCIAARGTSDNAGRYAQYLMGIEARLPVMLATPSVHTLYQAPPDLSRALVIGISQSGRSEDIFQVITDARQQGALTVSITNNRESRIAQAAEYHLDLMAGEEISIAATKTYSALATLPEAVQQTLSLSETLAERAERYRYMDHFVTLGRGYNYCTAFEISLKVKELCYIVSEQYSEADFRHGPIAIVHAGFPVMVVAPSGAPLHGLLDLLEKLHERKAECIVISNDDQALQFARTPLRLPAQPEWLTPVTAVIPGQLFAMNLALLKGHQVDRPEGLTKVTNTI
jgi:glutamine---fructose-6-phosphate transaminase (isomerizing)